MLTTVDIKRLAFEAGFDLCGIASPEIIENARQRFQDWLDDDFHGEMDWIAQNVDRRTDPGRLMPEVQSVIMLGVNYYQPNSSGIRSGYGRISRYARGRDYHKVIEQKTRILLGLIEQSCVEQQQAIPNCKCFVDYGPFMERTYAEQAGMGFIGKNGMLINKEYGSWIFLSEVLTDLKLECDDRDPVAHGHCGDCRLCIEACPTGAIVSPRRIDSRRCISYLTIERPTEIPPDLAKQMGELIFGCDICQEVCPYNQQPTLSPHSDLQSERGLGEFLSAEKVLALQTREDFLRLTAGSPLTRPRRENLQRNARIVLDNQSGKA